jgi:uncharacterized protein YecT (DUF1311 family)
MNPMALTILAALACSGGAQALDCTKAASPIERAICANPALMDQDVALGKAYTDRLAQDPARAASLRAEQRTWLAQRENLCGRAGVTPPQMNACLVGLYRSRLLALAGAAIPALPVPPARNAPAPGLNAPTGTAPSVGGGLASRSAPISTAAALPTAPAPTNGCTESLASPGADAAPRVRIL